jgi:hypothetical protein
MNQTLSYRAELFACNLAIHTLHTIRPLQANLQKALGVMQEREIPIWAATLAASGICGLLAGFTFYCLVVA